MNVSESPYFVHCQLNRPIPWRCFSERSWKAVCTSQKVTTVYDTLAVCSNWLPTNTAWPKNWYNFCKLDNRFSKLFPCQNQEKICNNTITKDPTTSPQVCCYTTLWNVGERGKLSQRLVDHVIGQWRRWLDCIVQQQGGHIEHLMYKLQDMTVTLENNRDTKHVSCC